VSSFEILNKHHYYYLHYRWWFTQWSPYLS